jgi:hypothetical protein
MLASVFASPAAEFRSREEASEAGRAAARAAVPFVRHNLPILQKPELPYTDILELLAEYKGNVHAACTAAMQLMTEAGLDPHAILSRPTKPGTYFYQDGTDVTEPMIALPSLSWFEKEQQQEEEEATTGAAYASALGLGSWGEFVETVQVGLTEEKSKKAAALQLCQQRGEPDPKGPCR